MALPPIPVPQFPNVPALPGVPPLPRAPGALGDVTVPLAVADSSGALSKTGGEWGIFNTSARSVLDWDCVFRFSDSQEYRVSDYPVEKGGFASYNKVKVPDLVRLTICKGGEASERQSFLQTVAILAASTDPLIIITPDAQYVNMTIDRYAFDRSNDSGANLLSIDVEFREIRQAKAAAFSNTQTPNAKSQVSAGTVSPQPPSQAQTAAAAGGAS